MWTWDESFVIAAWCPTSTHEIESNRSRAQAKTKISKQQLRQAEPCSGKLKIITPFPQKNGNVRSTTDFLGPIRSPGSWDRFPDPMSGVLGSKIQALGQIVLLSRSYSRTVTTQWLYAHRIIQLHNLKSTFEWLQDLQTFSKKAAYRFSTQKNEEIREQTMSHCVACDVNISGWEELHEYCSVNKRWARWSYRALNRSQKVFRN